MTETALWLLRHPEPEVGARGRCYGSLDIALSSEGIRHAHHVAESLANEPFAAIYTSPRQRCRQAAVILAGSGGRSIKIESIETLRELDFGEFEGRSYDEIARLYPDLYQQWMQHPTETRFPGGECFQEMSVRVLDTTNQLRARHVGQTIALMTHGGVIRAILSDALGMDPVNIFRIGQKYGAVNLVRYFDETPIIEVLNK